MSIVEREKANDRQDEIERQRQRIAALEAEGKPTGLAKALLAILQRS